MPTLSVIKADVGGYVGHADVHPDLMVRAAESLDKAKADGLLIDCQVQHVGDDIALVMTHEQGEDAEPIHKLAWDTFLAVTKVARELKMYGAGQDLLSDALSGNIKGMGPGSAEVEVEVHDVMENKRVVFSCPEELYDLLVFIGAQTRYVIKRVRQKDSGVTAAVTSTDRLNLIAGRYVGKDDPVLIVRCQSGLPAVGEVLEPWANPHLVFGWMRGSHSGPLMPCPMDNATPARFVGPPRVVGMGYQIANGRLIGPRDMLGDISFARAREKALETTDYMRSMGPFEPHRLPQEDMEYTTLPLVTERLEGRFEDLPG